MALQLLILTKHIYFTSDTPLCTCTTQYMYLTGIIRSEKDVGPDIGGMEIGKRAFSFYAIIRMCLKRRRITVCAPDITGSSRVSWAGCCTERRRRTQITVFFFYSGVIILLSAVAAAKGFFAVDKYMRMIYFSCRVILLKYLCRHKRDKRFDLNAECLLLWHCYTIVITACFLIILITVICDPFGVSLRKIVDHLLH